MQLTVTGVNVELLIIFPLTYEHVFDKMDRGGDDMKELQNLTEKMTHKQLVTVLRVLRALTEERPEPIPADPRKAD